MPRGQSEHHARCHAIGDALLKEYEAGGKRLKDLAIARGNTSIQAVAQILAKARKRRAKRLQGEA